MDNQTYIEKANRTANHDHAAISDRITPNMIEVLHGVIGMVTESGEAMDMIKKHVYYGKELDLVNLHEEIGDLMWYVALICSACNFDLSDIMEKNIEKLRARYGEKFSEERAINRDLNKERKILETVK